jgi:diphthamide synthase (EF-2-diphthine--ammonia ligase)
MDKKRVAVVKLLFSTVTDAFKRTSIHGVREELLEVQAESIGLPLQKIRIPEQCSNEIYGVIIEKELAALKELGIDHIAFGNLKSKFNLKLAEKNSQKIILPAKLNFAIQI